MAKKRWACLRKEYILIFVVVQMFEIVLIVNLKSVHEIDHISERTSIDEQMSRLDANKDRAGNCIKKRTDKTLNMENQSLVPNDRQITRSADIHIDENILNSQTMVKTMYPIPSLMHERARRKLETTSEEFWYFIRNELESLLRDPTVKDNTKNKVNEVFKTSREFKRTLTNDFQAFRTVDQMEEWRLNESLALGKLVQKRLHFLQNPDDCAKARKLVCFTTICGNGFTCMIHHYAVCLIVAYATERTMVVQKDPFLDVLEPLSETCTDASGHKVVDFREGLDEVQVVKLKVDSFPYRPKYLPPAVPSDLLDRIERFHGNPLVWWIGQIAAYIFRPTRKTMSYFDSKGSFTRPVVGVHVRRTDKVIMENGPVHKLETYMDHVGEWFNALEIDRPGVKRTVFLATDSPEVIDEAIEQYPDYTIMSNSSFSTYGSPSHRNSKMSRIGIVHDVYYLSRCDYLVCTFSSNVCRLAYVLMQTRNGDASKRFTSLDDIYYIDGQNPHIVSVIEPVKGEMELNVGDQVQILGNHWNGFSKVIRLTDRRVGFVPSFKLMERVVRVKMPPYPSVDRDFSLPFSNG